MTTTLKTAITCLSLGLFGVGCSNVPMPAAQNLAATIEAGGIHLTWDQVGLPATDLEIERRDQGGMFQKIMTTTTEAVDFMDATPGVVGCTYRVLAFADNQPFNGSYSKEYLTKAARVTTK